MVYTRCRVQKENPQDDPADWIPLLIQVLNHERAEARQRSVEPIDPRVLLLLVKRFQTLASLTPKRGSRRPDPGEIDAALNKINRILSRYIAFPSLVQRQGDPLNIGPMQWVQMRLDGCCWLELRLILAIIEVAQAGLIYRIKQCTDCRKWLFARFSHQRFCSEQCKEHFHHFNESDKERRRKWARENYQTRKELELGSRKAAHRKGGKR